MGTDDQPAPNGPASYRFGSFCLDLAQQALTRDGQPVALTPKAFDTLAALVVHHGRLVSKDELIRQVWPDTFVEEANLTQNISVLRKILGDDLQNPIYIETIPKRGYRFTAPVTRSDPRVAVVDVVPIDRPAAKMPRRLWRHVAWSSGAALAITLVWLVWPTPPPTRTRVAVLPIANLSGNSADDYLAEGLTEELITQLTRLQPDRIGVIGRATVARFLAEGRQVDAIERDLGVRYVIEGSLRREGERIRVSIRLISTPDGTLVWGEAYEQDWRGALPMQMLVSRAIASRLQATLALQPAGEWIRPGTNNPEAYDLYLKAHYFWTRRMHHMFGTAIALYEQAVALDPQFALAYAEMAFLYSAYPTPTMLPFYAKGLEAAQRAITIDERLAYGHFALGHLAMHLFDWPTAQQAFQRAEQLDPWLRSFDLMVVTGRFDDALAESKRGRELDPLNYLHPHGAGVASFYARRYADAIAYYQQALELDSHLYSRIRLGQVYASVGRYDEAIALLKPTGLAGLGELGYAYARANRRQDALDVLQELDRISATEFAMARTLVNTGLGNHDSAFHWLNAAYEARDHDLMYFQVEPRYDALRADPRYEELAHRIGFPSR